MNVGYNKIVTDCFLNSNSTKALFDFNGKSNTDAIITQLKGTTDNYSQYYAGAPAAEYCRSYSKGCKGVGEWYLPAAGELKEIALNKDAINTILTKLGKDSLLKNSEVWSSSQRDSSYAWYYHWSNSGCGNNVKYGARGVRPIANFTLPSNIIQFTLNGTTYNAVEGTTFKQWYSGIYNVDGFGIGNMIGINIDDIIQAGGDYTATIFTNGLYTVYSDGTYELSDNMPDTITSDQVTGIGLVTDKARMIVALDEWYASSNTDSTAWNGNKISAWGGYGKAVTDITSSSAVITDFNGRRNTDMIISQLSGTTDSYSNYYTGAPAAEYCRAYSNGCKGVGEWYLPSVGEMNEIVKFNTDINTALSKISGITLGSKSSSIWTSVQYSNNHAFVCSWKQNTDTYGYASKYAAYGVRPIAQLKSDIRIINFSIDGITYQAEEGMDWTWWANSIYNTSGYTVSNILASKTGIIAVL